MSSFAQRIRPFVDAEITAAERAAQPDESFAHLERAHVLGQASTVQHVRVHVLMFFWALRHRVLREAFGQIVRIVGAATKTAFGLVPTGNTGGANISPFERLPVPADLAQIITSARGLKAP